MLLFYDGAILVAPEAAFERELQRMRLTLSPFRAVAVTNDYAARTIDVELADLREYLARNHATNAGEIIRNHQVERSLINVFGQPNESLRATNGSRIDPLERPVVANGLPWEFAQYFRGSIAWHEQRVTEAREIWTSLLRQQPEKRRYKSTWAAYMLARSWEDEDRSKAIACFQKVRELAREGFVDHLGLASASLGWEARLQFRERRYAAAIELYLQQAASGEPSAANSLRFVASHVLEQGESTLKKLAANPRAQRVVTAYVISGGFRKPPRDIDGVIKEPLLQAAAKSPYLAARLSSWHTFKAPARSWLEAVESAKVRDVESAEQLALAAYQSGEMDMAQRWAKLSRPDSITSQWVQAKLLMRSGNVDGAAALLSGIIRQLALAQSSPSTNAAIRLDESLAINQGDPNEPPPMPSSQQILGELGALQLRQRDFIQALDTLLRSHFGIDADYVAECVLTLDELKNYVDRAWPAADLNNENPNERSKADIGTAAHIREVLARRLTRANRLSEARGYFPPTAVAPFNRFITALQNGSDPETSREQRAQSLWQAARVLAENGRKLYAEGTGPDGHYEWSLDSCNNPFDFSVTPKDRLAITNAMIAVTAEEKDRLLQNVPKRPLEFDYLALDLAWRAAELMPDNSDATAHVLFTAGTWMKNRDAKAADRFYKALVRRCRQTALGAEADRKRWFPKYYPDGSPAVVPP